MQFFHHPRNADYHKGKTKAVDQPHESMCEPVRQDNTGHISKAIEDIRHQISGQRSRSGRAYQVEPTCDLMADQIAEQCVEPHGNGSHIEHPGRSATHLGHNPEMVCPNSDQQKQNGNRQPIAEFPAVTLAGIAGAENGKDDTSHCKCGQSPVADIQDGQHALIEVAFGKGKDSLTAKALAQRRTQQAYQDKGTPGRQQILQPVTAEDIDYGGYVNRTVSNP